MEGWVVFPAEYAEKNYPYPAYIYEAIMEAEGTMTLPSRNFLAASVALGALAAGIAFLLYRSPLLLLMSWSWEGKQLWIV